MSDAVLDSLIDTYATTLADLRAVVDAADEELWAIPTGCPGWSVADNVSHIIGLELLFSGQPDPGADVAITEASVALRRGRSKRQLLEEYDEITALRMAALRSEIADRTFDPSAAVHTPFGTLPSFASAIRMRIFDVFAHCQDIRRALGAPGGLEGPAFDITMRNIIRGLSWLVPAIPRLAGTALGVVIDGAPQVVDFTGPKPFVREGNIWDAAAVLSTTASNLIALGCGRSDADVDAVTVTGDAQLAADVLASMGVTP